MKDKLELMKNNCISELKDCVSLAALANIKVKYLGKSGELTIIMRGMKDVTAEERPMIGKLVNEVRDCLNDEIESYEKTLYEKELEERLASEKIDITLPHTKQTRGGLHPLSIVKEQICEIFASLGYEIAEGREIEYDYYNFEALNIPADHPARDSQDTFFITDKILLRSQTSTMQIHEMEKGNLPIKILNPGRVYRSDEVDATHSPMFHQIEGLVVDKGITLCDLKGTLDYFARKFFGEDTKTRFRPSFFPFTEPSIEVDATCSQCFGKGCRVCKGTGWIEIMGAGIVNTKVLEGCGIDSKIYSGFAFGMGLDRSANIKYGITDLRTVFENNIQFLRQFK